MACYAGAGDRLNGASAAVALRHKRRQQTRRERRLVGAGHMALDAIATVAWKANIGEIDRAWFGRRAAINNERLTGVGSGVDAMNQPFVVNVLGRLRSVDGFSLVAVGLRCVVAHDAEFRVVSRFAVGGEPEMANIAVFDLDRFTPRHGFFVGDREILDHINPDVALSFEKFSVGFFHVDKREALKAYGA